MYIELNDGESVTIAKNHDKNHKINRHCFTIVRRGDDLDIREFGNIKLKEDKKEKMIKKTSEEIKELHDFISYFNDGRFMNQDYRKGILDALDFIMYENSILKRTLDNFNKKLK